MEQDSKHKRDKKREEDRKRRNQELLRKMKNKENLAAYEVEDSWYPRRPPIKKDKKLVKQLFDDED